jgi:exodeoxyribonuclease VII large subunit
MSSEIIYTVTDFVAVCNQILDISLGSVQITGELASFKISKNRWVFFDLKDDFSNLRFFGTVYQLPGPLEDGMLLTVRGVPQLHPKFGFSVTVQSILLAGEGTIKKASQLLEQQLLKEGLFEQSRKRSLPYPPAAIGIISSSESAGYADFIKIANERWGGLEINLIDVQVQGEYAPSQITQAIQYFNQHDTGVEVLVIIRGGGSADDLQAFNREDVVRAVVGSRVPTLVAIGHETDLTLAERAADLRASTPSNSAQLLLPDKKTQLQQLRKTPEHLHSLVEQKIKLQKTYLENLKLHLSKDILKIKEKSEQDLNFIKNSLNLLNPKLILKRGYVIVRQKGQLVQRTSQFSASKTAELQFYDGKVYVKSKEPR